MPHTLLCKRAYTDLFGRMHGGVRGVRTLSSGLPGPCVGIIMASNESTVPTLTAYADLWMRHLLMPRRGKIVWVLNSMAACDVALWHKEGLTGTDMSQLPPDLTQRMDDSPAIRRAQELLPIWSMLDVALELTTTTDDKPWLSPLANWSNDATAAIGLPTGPLAQPETLTASQFYGTRSLSGQSTAAVAQLHLPTAHIATLAHTPIRNLFAHLGVTDAPRLAATA